MTIHERTEPTTLKLSIRDDDQVIAEDDVVFESSGTQVIRLAVDDIRVNNNFRFVAEGLAGLVFRNETTLNVESKNCSLFIQADKSIYKPSDTIRVRILVLGFDLRPHQLDDDAILRVSVTVNMRVWSNLARSVGRTPTTFPNGVQFYYYAGCGQKSYKAVESCAAEHGRFRGRAAAIRCTGVGRMDNYCRTGRRGESVYDCERIP